jgi:hypothetical protein
MTPEKKLQVQGTKKYTEHSLYVARERLRDTSGVIYRANGAHVKGRRAAGS